MQSGSTVKAGPSAFLSMSVGQEALVAMGLHPNLAQLQHVGEPSFMPKLHKTSGSHIYSTIAARSGSFSVIQWQEERSMHQTLNTTKLSQQPFKPSSCAAKAVKAPRPVKRQTTATPPPITIKKHS